MAYARFKIGRKRRFNKRKKRITSNTKRLSRQVAALRAATRPEIKYRDWYTNWVGGMALRNPLLSGGNAPTDNWFINNMIPDVNQGIGANERTGQRIRLKSVQFTASLKANAGALLGAQVRVMLVLSKEANVALPRVLEDYTSGAHAAVTTLRDPTVTRLCTILYDKVFVLSPVASRSGVLIRFFRRLNAIVTYDESSALAMTNNMTLYIFSDYPAGGTPPELQNVNTRIRFTDV